MIRTLPQAVNDALVQEMVRDDNVILLGEDIGRIHRYALGAAMPAKRPVVELMFIAFSLVAMDQILNQSPRRTM
ncbi:MAG: hypothetical protein ACR2HJ_07725 [Fimbriimonadales bacterium]